MNRSRIFAGSLTGMILVFSSWLPSRAVAQLGDTAEAAGEALTFSLEAEQPLALPSRPWVAQVIGIPDTGPVEKRGVVGIPTFTGSVVVGRKTYKYTLVGGNPAARNAKNVTVPVPIIPVKFVFDDGTVLDPTVLGPFCAGSDTPLNLTLQSPIFQDVDYGDGPRQFNEEVRRQEFWKLTGAPGAINPSYSLRMAASVLPTVQVIARGSMTQDQRCGTIGLVDVNQWDALVRTQLLPQLRMHGVGPQTFPLFLAVNVVLYLNDPVEGPLYIAGYHSAAAGQTYGYAEYDARRGGAYLVDVAAISHELGEWYDDPFITNPTPPWGHTGQVQGCQSNLEVGDPLTGHLLKITMPNGFTYHPQELAFFSWFFDQVPSLGINGWYSSNGTLLSPAAPCR